VNLIQAGGASPSPTAIPMKISFINVEQLKQKIIPNPSFKFFERGAGKSFLLRKFSPRKK